MVHQHIHFQGVSGDDMADALRPHLGTGHHKASTSTLAGNPAARVAVRRDLLA